jgi:hypothetical protein
VRRSSGPPVIAASLLRFRGKYNPPILCLSPPHDLHVPTLCSFSMNPESSVAGVSLAGEPMKIMVDLVGPVVEAYEIDFWPEHTV